jgi:four helix bundle protein
MAANDLIVYTKTENLLYRLYPVLVNYPKSEKFALCQQIKDCVYNILKNIALGNSVKSKRLTYLQEADASLQILKVLLKLSRHRRYISEGFFKDIDLQLTEINKMLSAYIKSTVSK